MHANLYIFYYHGVVERKRHRILERNFLSIEEFGAHVAELRNYLCISLADIEEVLSDDSRKDPAVMLTVDDGHSSNLVIAEILGKHGVPGTFFVTTGALDGKTILWPTEIALLLLEGTARHVVVSGTSWSLESESERHTAFHQLRRWLKSLPAEHRNSRMDEIRAQFPLGEAERLYARWPSLHMLSWSQVSELSKSGVAIGSHGVNHEIHHEAQPAVVRATELLDSKCAIEEQLDIHCDAFAFPNGDVNDDSSRELAETGFRYGFSTAGRPAVCHSNRLLLPRMEAGPLQFALLKNGVNPSVPTVAPPSQRPSRSMREDSIRLNSDRIRR